MSHDKHYGSDDKYYAAASAAEPTRAHHDQQLERMLSELLEKAFGDVKASVTQALKRWNLNIRDHLRSELALRLSAGDDKKAVPIRVSDGLPTPLLNVVRDHPAPMDWWLLFNLPKTRVTQRFLADVQWNYSSVVEANDEVRSLATLEQVKAVGLLVEAFEHRAEQFGLLKALSSIDQDVLGGYFFRIPEIRLYWLVIGVFSALLGVSVQDLTVVVLAHELAHAYSHLGKDIDSQAWDTAAFARADLRIVEGIAQFYTQAVCARIAVAAVGPRAAFEALLERQPEPYRVHRKWIGGSSRGGEIMRAALIVTRSKQIHDYADFSKRLAAISSEMS